jgi:amino acid permease
MVVVYAVFFRIIEAVAASNHIGTYCDFSLYIMWWLCL